MTRLLPAGCGAVQGDGSRGTAPGARTLERGAVQEAAVPNPDLPPPFPPPPQDEVPPDRVEGDPAIEEGEDGEGV